MPPRPLLTAIVTLVSLSCPAAPGRADAPADAASPTPTRDARIRSESLRSPDRLLRTPLAVSVVEREEILRARPAIDLADALDLVPGVLAQSSENFAQDTRVAIRGFGARSTFGIRGVRVQVDGIPTTLPDGQSEVDSIDLAFADRIDVVRGTTSSLFGGAGGGLVSISTLAPTEARRIRLRSSFGTDRTWRHAASITGTTHDTGYVVGLAHTRTAGFRAHARARQTALLTKLERELASGAHVALRFSSVWAPEAQDPGGLNRAERAADRGAAAPGARIFGAGEKLNQQRVALTYDKSLGPGQFLQARAYRVWRDFSGALPLNRRIDFDRTVTGGGILHRLRLGPVRISTGADLDVQQDRRRNYTNPGGSRGDLILRQSEEVRSLGPFVQLDWFASESLQLVLGARYDWTEFEVGDRFTADGTASDSIRFRELSPRFAVQYEIAPAQLLRASVTTGFQVPTTTELRPADALGGFDNDREAERAVTFELGAKGALGSTFFYDIAVFDIRIDDVLVPFEDMAGDTFFRNAGRVRRRGAELAISGNLTSRWALRASYTYADYRYRDFDPNGLVDLDGRREPNAPQHSAALELRYDHPQGFFATLAVRHFSDIELDDSNTLESGGATTADIRFGFRLRRGDLELQPFAGIRNLTGVEFDGTVRPNAAAGRFFEPAPEIQSYLGIDVQF